MSWLSSPSHHLSSSLLLRLVRSVLIDWIACAYSFTRRPIPPLLTSHHPLIHHPTALYRMSPPAPGRCVLRPTVTSPLFFFLRRWWVADRWWMQGRGGEADERRELGEEGDRRGTAPDVTRAGAIHQFPHQGDNHKRNFFPKFFFF